MSDLKIDKLPNEIMSSAQLYQYISNLGNIIDKQTKEASNKAKDDQDLMQDTLKIFFKTKPGLDEIVELKEKLEEIIQTAPAVRLTLSDFPEPDFCNKLSAWFRSIHPFCLVEILVDSSIIGGVIIRSGRRIYDYSIRSQLNRAENALTGIIADA